MRSSINSPDDFLANAAEWWLREHPDEIEVDDYTSTGNEFLQRAEREYFAARRRLAGRG